MFFRYYSAWASCGSRVFTWAPKILCHRWIRPTRRLSLERFATRGRSDFLTPVSAHIYQINMYLNEFEHRNSLTNRTSFRGRVRGDVVSALWPFSFWPVHDSFCHEQLTAVYRNISESLITVNVLHLDDLFPLSNCPYILLYRN